MSKSVSQMSNYLFDSTNKSFYLMTCPSHGKFAPSNPKNESQNLKKQKLRYKCHGFRLLNLYSNKK